MPPLANRIPPDSRGPLAAFDVAQPDWFQDGLVGPAFRRLRQDTPISYCEDSMFGPYWSVTRHADIEAIELDTERFSSAHLMGGITIGSKPDAPDFFPMFIAMDPPDHGARRRTILPCFKPSSIQQLAVQIRADTIAVLDALPQGETFDWADRVAIELTAITLATLLDFPAVERRKLVHWSNVMTAIPPHPLVATMADKMVELEECFARFAVIWEQRKAAPPAEDLISILAHGEHTRDMAFDELCGTIILLIVAGNDTTRSSISGSLVALHSYPDQYARLRSDPGLLATMIPEVMRWQTPISHMRRTATCDVDFNGVRFRKGDKVVLWYISANRDEAVFEDPDAFVIDRPNARRHLAFGHGIHYCAGARLGEMQVRILWEEMMRRGARFELAGPPLRTASAFINGYAELPVRLWFD